MKHFLCSILAFLYFNICFAQENYLVEKDLREKIYVHTDNNFYTTGEIIWFAIYVFDAENLLLFSGSKTAYVELISPENESIIQQKIKLDSARGNGSIYLPLDLASGNYTLKVYTSWLKNFGKNHYYTQPITLINPFEKLRPSQMAELKDTVEIKSTEGRVVNFKPSPNRTKIIKIESDKKQYSPREKVLLTLSAEDNIPGHYSIAVNRMDSLSNFPLPDMVTALINPAVDETINETFNQTIRYLPEVEGQILQFKIADATKKPVIGEKAYLSIPGSKFKFYTSISDESGTVNFIVNQLYGNEEVVINFENKNNYSVEFVSPFESNFQSKYPGLKLSENSLKSLQERNLNMQVQNVFVKDHLIKIIHPTERLPFYGVADKIYYLDDYTRFPTMQEVMVEYIPEIRLRQNNNEFQLRVYEIPYANFFEGEPLVLVNGIPVQDANILMKTDPLNIEKIEVVARKFLWGNSYFEGIISLTTYPDIEINGILEDVTFRKEIGGYMPKRIFYSPELDTNESANIPDYRNLLYWNGELNLNRKKELEFFTGDRSGTYLVRLQGVDKNGNFSSNDYIFEVVK